MKVDSTSPVPINFFRSGGAITLGRLDFWLPSAIDWTLVASVNFHAVTSPIEENQLILPTGSYTVVVVCRVEESVNGIYGYRMVVAGSVVSEKAGNVDSTANPHDSTTFKNQFILSIV